MKRIIVLIMVFIVFCSTSAFAQQFENESEFYLKVAPIDRVYVHALGYRVDYFNADRTLTSFWVPKEWFISPRNPGSIIYGTGPGYPYISFYFKAGELDHFRLNLVEDLAHASWAMLDQGNDYSNQFPSPDSKPKY